MTTLKDLQNKKPTLDDESRALVDQLTFRESEIAEIELTSKTKGWKIIERKCRDEIKLIMLNILAAPPESIPELHGRIGRVNSILQILKAGDPTSQRQELEDIISKL